MLHGPFILISVQHEFISGTDRQHFRRIESEMKKDDFSVFIQEGKDHFVVNEGDDIQLKCSANSSVNLY